MAQRIYIGTAGWSVPRSALNPGGAPEGTHLERYARLFRGVEINSSFHRPHAIGTYAKWATAAPAHFRFAVKMPRAITHDLQLRRTRAALDQFLEEARGLGPKHGPLLVQLPPSLAFNARVARTFFDLLRARFDGPVVCEPRHPTWFSASADALLVQYQIARVAADPAPAPGADVPGGWRGIVYYRLHGSPRKYWSRYEPSYIAALASALVGYASSAPVWCIFDNTASGAAFENASELQEAIGRTRRPIVSPVIQK
jgi:uncharacterized protein YecE (DUF72 family)